MAFERRLGYNARPMNKALLPAAALAFGLAACSEDKPKAPPKPTPKVAAAVPLAAAANPQEEAKT